MKRHLRFFLETLGIWAVSAAAAWGLTTLLGRLLSPYPFWCAAAVMAAGLGLDLLRRARAMRDEDHSLWTLGEVERSSMRFAFQAVTAFECVILLILLFLGVMLALSKG